MVLPNNKPDESSSSSNKTPDHSRSGRRDRLTSEESVPHCSDKYRSRSRHGESAHSMADASSSRRSRDEDRSRQGSSGSFRRSRHGGSAHSMAGSPSSAIRPELAEHSMAAKSGSSKPKSSKASAHSMEGAKDYHKPFGKKASESSERKVSLEKKSMVISTVQNKAAGNQQSGTEGKDKKKEK